MLKPFEVHDNRQLPSEISEPLLEWNAENGLAVPMDMQFEFYDNLAEHCRRNWTRCLKHRAPANCSTRTCIRGS